MNDLTTERKMGTFLGVYTPSILTILGVVLFLLPLCGFLALMAYDFAAAALSIHETSREPGGLPYPMIPLLKSIVIVMPVAVALQGISMLMRSMTCIVADSS